VRAAPVALARGGKLAKIVKKIQVKFQIVSFMCLCLLRAIKTKYLQPARSSALLGLSLRPVRLGWYYTNFVLGLVHTELQTVLFLGSMALHLTLLLSVV